MEDKRVLSTLLVITQACLQVITAQQQDVCQQFYCPPGLHCVAWETSCFNPPCWKIPRCQALRAASANQGGQCPSYWSECSNQAGFNCQTDQDCAFNMKCCASHECGKICIFPITHNIYPSLLRPSFPKDIQTDRTPVRPGQLQPGLGRRQCPRFWDKCSNTADTNCRTDQDCRFGMICCESHECGSICVFSVGHFGPALFPRNGGNFLPPV